MDGKYGYHSTDDDDDPEVNYEYIAERSDAVKNLTKKCERRSHTYAIYVRINNSSKVRMIVDTDAPRTIIDVSDWKEMGEPELKRTTMAYGYAPLLCGRVRVHGKCYVKVQYDGRQYDLPALVADTEYKVNVLGLGWLRAISANWNALLNAQCDLFHLSCKGMIESFNVKTMSSKAVQVREKWIAAEKKDPLMVTIIANGVPLSVHLKTTMVWTVITRKMWTALGKPKLLNVAQLNGGQNLFGRIPGGYTISSRKSGDLELYGYFFLKVMIGSKPYNPMFLVGKKRSLELPALYPWIGTRWMPYLGLDYNSRFASIDPKYIKMRSPYRNPLGRMLIHPYVLFDPPTMIGPYLSNYPEDPKKDESSKQCEPPSPKPVAVSIA